MTVINRFTIFKSDSFGHGADKRTAQISEILKEEGREWKQIPGGFNSISFSLNYFKNCYKTIINFLKILFIIRRTYNIRSLYRTISYVSQFKGVFSLPKAKGDEIILLETSKMEYSFVIPHFKKKGYKIVALPHNVESLVPDQKSALTKKTSPFWLFEEIRILKECSTVFAISKEDTLLLRQCGIKAEYLPYFPTKDIENKLLEIRTLRNKKERSFIPRKKILLIGSAVNSPTRQGMADRISFFKKREIKNCDLIVAGYGTNSLKSLAENTLNVLYLGEITNNELFGLLAEVDAILIHQPPTSGALTRIIESLIAGVPVLINFDGARNYFNTNGVYIYSTDDQLDFLIQANLEVPVCPQYPIDEVSRFKAQIY